MPTRRALPDARADARPRGALLGRPPARHPGHPPHRDQRQGVDGGHGHRAASAPRACAVGTYTSPNLERGQRAPRSGNGEPIDDEALTEVLEASPCSSRCWTSAPTRFELLTAAALRWFADEAVDVAVIEVGLGGTWDSTNVVDGEVAVITNISYDHTEVLGPTLEDIAADKAGIFKPGSRGGGGRDRPRCSSPLIARRADDGGGGRGLAARATSSTAPRTGWRSAAG